MILVDANLLLYSKVEDYPQHETAVAWLEQQINDSIRVGLPWPSLLAFLRIVTNPRIYKSPLSIDVAWTQVDEWLALPNIWIPQPTDQHQILLSQLLKDTQATANLVPDAHLAVLAMEHGLEICTTDTDFARFPGCKWRNPIKAVN
ncbi:MAG: type II toxin-antitoxin system VapC family toxin [Phormidesmis sp.]